MKQTNCTLFSMLSRDYDTNLPLIVLEGLPCFKNATMTAQQLRKLAEKLMAVADEADKGDAGEFKDGATMEQYFSICDYENTIDFQDGES